MAQTTVRYTSQDYRDRPREPDPETVDYILERVANGEALDEIVEPDRDLPLPGTFLRWLREDPTLEERYRVAMHSNYDIAHHRILPAAYSDERYAQLQVNALKMYIEMGAPQKYGPRSVVKTLGPDDEDVAGVDYAADIRREIETMARNMEARARAAADSQPSPDSPAE